MHWLPDVDDAFARSQADSKPVLVDFSAAPA